MNVNCTGIDRSAVGCMKELELQIIVLTGSDRPDIMAAWVELREFLATVRGVTIVGVFSSSEPIPIATSPAAGIESTNGRVCMGGTEWGRSDTGGPTGAGPRAQGVGS